MAPPPPVFDARGVSAPDAVVAIRSLRRRFAEAFDQVEDPADLTRQAAGARSPVDHAVWTADALAMIATALRQVLVADHPEVALPSLDPSGALSKATDSTAALAQLGDSARALADTMAEVPGNDWSRTGHGPTGEVSALDIVRLGVQIGIEHLRAAEADVAGH